MWLIWILQTTMKMKIQHLDKGVLKKNSTSALKPMLFMPLVCSIVEFICVVLYLQITAGDSPERKQAKFDARKKYRQIETQDAHEPDQIDLSVEPLTSPPAAHSICA